MASSLLRTSLLRASLRCQSTIITSGLRSLFVRRAIVPQIQNLSLRFASSSSTKKSLALRADENLKQVLDSEIKCAESEGIEDQMVEMPEGFPFEIVDNPGDQTIILKREFTGEKINITVMMNAEDDMEDNVSDTDDNGPDEIEPSFSLIVNIDKGQDSTVEFCCDLSSSDLEIESMTMKRRDDSANEDAYQGPAFTDLDVSLQNALKKYLKDRSIESELFDFLREYMMDKDEREYLLWLKNMKGFVES